MIQPDRLSSVIDSFPFLQEADDWFKSSFISRSTIVQLEKGTTICQEGVQCSRLALILNGTARVFKLSESGRELTLYRIDSGQSCILTASCIISGNPFPAIATCEDDLEAILVSNRDVLQWLDDSAAWRGYLFGLISTRLSDVISVVEEVAFGRMDRRIADYLLSRVAIIDNPLVKVTHQEIASELGTSREVVSRILKDLEHQQYLQVRRGEIRLTDIDRLRDKGMSGWPG